MQINRLNWEDVKAVKEYNKVVEFDNVLSASKENDNSIRLLILDGDGREWEESGCQNGYVINILTIDEIKEAIETKKVENKKLLKNKGMNDFEVACYSSNNLLLLYVNSNDIHKVKTSFTSDGFSIDSVDYKVFKDGKYITVDETEYDRLDITEFKETVSNYS